MDAAPLLLAYVGMLAFPAAVLTGGAALLIRALRRPRKGRLATSLAIGSVAPACMLAGGLIVAWPWPWRQPSIMTDMIPAGPGLVLSAFPTWLLCLAASWLVLRRAG